MKDKDFGFVVVLLIAIFFSKEIKGFVAEKLGKDEPPAIVPGTFLGRTPSDELLSPRLGESRGLLNQDREPGSQAARLLEELSTKPQAPLTETPAAVPSAEPATGGLSFPLFPRKRSPFEEMFSDPTTGRLDSTAASGEALPKSDRPAGGQ